jgi:hypothetical protein
MLAQQTHRLCIQVALVLAALIVGSNSLPASAQAPGSRFVILMPSGDPTLAHALGQGVRERAQAVLTTDGFAAVLGPAACSDADCAAPLLENDAADFAMAIALWGHDAVCERVAVTLIDDHAGTFSGEVPVTDTGVPAAIEGAIHQALETARSGASTLRVEGNPAGATITLDRIPWGAMPHEDTVTRGDHSISVSADGYVTQRRDFTLTDQPMTLTLELARGENATTSDPIVVPGGASTGPDVGWLGVGIGAGVAGLALVGVGAYGFATPDSFSGGRLYERNNETSSAVWIAAGSVLVVAGVVAIVWAVSSGSSSATARRFDGVIHF